MAPKKKTTRTVKATGEKVVYHPDGTKQLMSGNTLAATLAATDSQFRSADTELTGQRLAAVEAKRESLAAGDAVPAEKRVV